MATVDLKRLIAHKKEGYYPSFIHYDERIPAKGDVVISITVPMDKAYVVARIAYDIIDSTFRIMIRKDGRLVLPDTMITGDLMDYNLTEPYIVMNRIDGHIVNTDTEKDHDFRATMYILVCDVEKFEKEMW